ETNDASINLVRDNSFFSRAHVGPLPDTTTYPDLSRDLIIGRAVIDRTTIHIHDLAAEPEAALPARRSRKLGARTVLAAPLLRDDAAIGVIIMRRLEVRPFTEQQIAL